MVNTQDLHILEFRPLKTPAELKTENPVPENVAQMVTESRQVIKRMLRGKDNRLLLIVGPCSIHDKKAAFEYAERLARLNREVQDEIFIVMRVYFEKPRTTIGWKGLINDPNLNGKSDIELGLRTARQIMLKIAEMNLPIATEFLDPIVPQYISDLVSWAAIGARTTESQTHREMSSGVSMPVGFKNNTDGNLQIAIDAMKSCRYPHTFLGIDQEGKSAIVQTSGNIWSHLILRGGRDKTNYDAESIAKGIEILQKNNLPAYVMVDCSHANSSKQHRNQVQVWESCIEQRINGNESLFGMMIESHLFEGNQPVPADMTELNDPAQLKFGVSITDACIDWETTENIIRSGYHKIKEAKGSPILAK